MPEAQTLKFNLEGLDWDALDEIEEIVGHPIYAELEARNPSIRTIRAIVLWQLRKADPTMTLETMPDVRSLSVEMAPKGQPAPLAPGRRGSRSKRLPSSSSGTG